MRIRGYCMCYVYLMDFNAEDFWNRVGRLLVGDLTQKWLSHETGINPSTLSTWRIKNRSPHAHEAVAIAQALGVSVEYLVTGKDDYEDKRDLQETILDEDKVFMTPSQMEYVLTGEEKFVVIPVYDQKISAGYGQELLDSDVEPIRHITVMKRLVSGFEPERLRAVEVSGDSMTGITLFHGDTVVFVQDYIKGDGVYVLLVEGQALVKRLEFDLFDHKVKVHSENPKYETKVVDSDSDLMRIQGKVIGWVHNHPY